MTSRRRTREALGAMLGLLLAVTASAQTNPVNLPLANLGNVTAAGSFTYDWSDGAGGDISYGGDALGVSLDGKFIYVACSPGGGLHGRRGIAKLEIPALGGVARVAAPCQGPTGDDLIKLLPTADGGSNRIGGVVEYPGGVCVTGFWTYDANNQTKASHWCGRIC